MSRISFSDFEALLQGKDIQGIKNALENCGANVYLNAIFEKDMNWIMEYECDCSRNTPLMFVTDNIELMDLMLDLGADPNIDYGSGTPLMKASNDCNTKAVSCLLKGGAKPVSHEIETGSPGFSSIAFAIENDCLEIVTMLLDFGAVIFPKNLYSVKSIEMMKIALNFTTASEYLAILLLNTYLDKDEYAMYEFFFNNIDSEIRRAIKDRLLFESVICSKIKYVRFLLENGADCNWEDKYHNTCLTCFYDPYRTYKVADNEEIIFLLLRNGAHTKSIENFQIDPWIKSDNDFQKNLKDFNKLMKKYKEGV